MPERAEKFDIKSDFGHAGFDNYAVKHNFRVFLLLFKIFEQEIALTVAHYLVSPADGSVGNHHGLRQIILIIYRRLAVDCRLDLPVQQQV